MAVLHVKSPNGTQKDIDLDKIFTTDGGTINGSINILNGIIQGHGRNGIPILMFLGNDLENYDGYIELCGSTNWENGGALFAYGLNCTGDNMVPGGFSLTTWDGEIHHCLNGTNDGHILWDYKSLVVIDSYIIAENGNFYIRYTNGIQECFGTYMVPANTPDGLKTFTFQAPFLSGSAIRSLQLTPFGVLNGKFTNVIVAVVPNETTFQVHVETMQATVPVYDVYFWMHAVGWWK